MAAQAAAEPRRGDANACWPKARETSADASAMPWPCVARDVLLVTTTRLGYLTDTAGSTNAQLRVFNAGGCVTLVAPSFGDRRRQLGGSRRQRVSPRACSLAACTRELTVMGTALTPRVHAVQVDSCSCVLAGAVAPQLLEMATMSLRLSCLLIEVSALLRRCLLCFAAHPVRHARRRWRRFDLWTI